MPFKKGLAPIRRTLQYLNSSKLVLRERVKVFCMHYNMEGENHKGTKEFVFWHLTQLQYKNPNVQVLTFTDMTPTPFIRIFTENEEDILVDCDSKSREEIHDHIKKVICKSDEKLREEAIEREKKDNPANFGWGCERQCICEIPGQIPCPGVVPLPKVMRGKYKNEEAN
ncbi:putative 28S ribosomal protein S25, mitochondrial [Armadillidium nasatum]|uniref:Small ribosomal subunit protein mS25 n=1 Tax=Armadillidium nasatum TaxID=96803 RepID=A0A5N5TPL3_9CRUS|nr:putative 28S ribosomal protein S25, mitochondrial [Armadillidium nasatum]